MFDSHCHLQDLPAAEQLPFLERARAAGVTGVLLAGVDVKSWQIQTELALIRPECAVSFGIHPQMVAEASAEELRAMLPLLAQRLSDEQAPRAVALGELGLDRSKPEYEAAWDLQVELFRAQLGLARERELPVILHILDAQGHALQILRADGLPKCGGVVHSFSGSSELVRDYVGLGLHISFSGAVCNPRAARLRRAVPRVPAERLLVETDAPYQTPGQHWPSPNESAFLPTVIQHVAELRGTTASEVAASTEQNARRLFGLDVA